jgi:hypothetical protein
MRKYLGIPSFEILLLAVIAVGISIGVLALISQGLVSIF